MRKTLLTITLISSLLVMVDAQAANLYRYRDNNGNTFLGTQVPPEFAKNGYTIIDERGRVVQEVPRALTQQELDEQAGEIEQRRLDQEAQLKQKEEDAQLLRLYRSPEEVTRRRDSSVEELDAQITALTGLLHDAQGRVDTLQERADNNVAAGRDVPESVAAQLQEATEERDRLNRQISRIESEKAEVFETAQKNIDRLKVLLNLE